jgi:hypothetical protein
MRGVVTDVLNEVRPVPGKPSVSYQDSGKWSGLLRVWARA